MIVSDTGPLIALARIGRLDLLRQVPGELAIPQAVFDEMTVRHDRPGATEVQDSDWMHTQAVGDQVAVSALPSALHLGERQAIVLAGELRASILIDEKRGRAVARERGRIVLGSLWILAEAKRLGIIEQAKPLLDAMLAAAYWIDKDLLPPFLQEVGENISS